MKRRSNILICLCLAAVLALSACGGNPSQTADGTYVKPVEPSETAPGPGPSRDTTAAPSDDPSVPDSSETDAATVPAAQETTAPPAVIGTGSAPGEGATTALPDGSRDSSEETAESGGSAEDPAETGGPAAPGTFTEEDLIFTYKGRTIQVDEVFVYTDFEEAWGSPRIEKAQACIGGGYDENYYFGDHLAVSTLGDSGEQVIYDIFVDEPGFATAKGAEIGRTDRDALHRIYGDPEGSFGRTDRYAFGEILVSFTFDGGILAGIDYNHTQN